MKSDYSYCPVFNSLLFATFFLWLVSCQNEPSLSDASAARPNIVVIMADDMGYSDLGCYGSEIKTPHLNALAQSGVRFHHFYNTARCCPTRAALLTGLYPHEAGMGGMVSDVDSNPEPGPYQGFLNNQCFTLAELLKPAGYATYMAGKWHVGEKPEYWPTRRGFDQYFGLISGASSYYEVITEQPRVRQMAYNGQPWTPPTEGFYMTDALSDSASSFLENHFNQSEDQPFFLYLAYTAPHWPLHAPEETIQRYKGMYQDGWVAKRQERYQRMLKQGIIDSTYQLGEWEKDIPDWDNRDDSLQWEQRMEVYAAMVDRMDQGIGKVFETLQKNDAWDNTLIFFLSDNGGSPEDITGRKLNDPTVKIGAPGSYVAYRKPWAVVSNTPFRRYKRWVEEGGIASPLIMHWPDGLSAESNWVDDYAHVVDIFATVAEVTQASYPDSLQALRGQNLLPLVTNNSTVSDRPLFWEHLGHQAMRQGNWKIVSQAPEYQWYLYNMAEDPTELHDVSADFPEVLQQMSADYEQWAQEVGVQKQ
uniref:Arylsulfatase n=1 Tax=Roseihalotalea indica TaxID=2867963 RepID=A0AA49JGR1_9BACT|nr:arylsulfatase [Tunicatimonas sp. TK19036]